VTERHEYDMFDVIEYGNEAPLDPSEAPG